MRSEGARNNLSPLPPVPLPISVLYFSLWLSPYPSIYLSIYLLISRYLSISLHLSPSLSISLYLSFYLFLPISMSISLPLSLSGFLSLCPCRQQASNKTKTIACFGDMCKNKMTRPYTSRCSDATAIVEAGPNDYAELGGNWTSV